MWAVVLGDFLFYSRRTTGKVYICLGDESPIHQYYWRSNYKFGRFFPCVTVSPGKLLTNHKHFKFVNPSQRYKESPRIFFV